MRAVEPQQMATKQRKVIVSVWILVGAVVLSALFLIDAVLSDAGEDDMMILCKRRLHVDSDRRSLPKFNVRDCDQTR